MKFLIPNFISVSRVLVGFWFLLFGIVPSTLFLLSVLVLVASTDMLDGWIARKLNSTSKVGAVIDTLADKIFVLTIMLKLVFTDVLQFPLFILIVLQYLLLPLGNWIHIKRYAEFPSPNLVTRVTAIMAIGMVFSGVALGNPMITLALGIIVVVLNFVHLASRILVR